MQKGDPEGRPSCIWLGLPGNADLSLDTAREGFAHKAPPKCLATSAQRLKPRATKGAKPAGAGSQPAATDAFRGGGASRRRATWCFW